VTAAVPYKGLITASVMLATIMQALDTTIANIALPHIQANLSATQDEAAWVLTSYIIAAAVMFPLTGWLANKYGRRPVFLTSIILFIAASALCGAAANLDQLVAFRMLQGVGGAALVPLSQAILFEINEPKDYGRAMSLWGMAATAPPAIGPTLGGWLTDNYSWRWVFYINLPIGLLAFVGLLLALPRDKSATARRFDLTGFVALSVAIASFQLMLDRGQLLDWFSSREIVAEAVIAGTAFYIFLMHILSSAHPFVSPAIFKDRNYVGAVVFLFLFGVVLLPPWRCCHRCCRPGSIIR
jgi:MFS transporter, DHA2 family, multidrug resistance protein